MDHPAEDAPLVAESRAGSEQVLIEPNVTPGNSNGRALKIAGLTALACLLVASQIFTAYLVFDQKQQIQGLQTDTRNMENKMTQRSRMTPQRMVMPINSLPLLDFFDDSKPAPSPKHSPQTAPPKKQEEVALPSVEKQLQELMEDFEVPNFNKSFLANLQSLKQQRNESDWKSFESWLRYWLIFQMAQKSASPTPQPVGVAMSKCQEAASSSRQIGGYKPQCDEQGNYKTMQCWHATSYCWCVDQDGSPIKGTETRGFPDCDQVLASRRASPNLLMTPGLFDDEN